MGHDTGPVHVMSGPSLYCPQEKQVREQEELRRKIQKQADVEKQQQAQAQAIAAAAAATATAQ